MRGGSDQPGGAQKRRSHFLLEIEPPDAAADRFVAGGLSEFLAHQAITRPPVQFLCRRLQFRGAQFQSSRPGAPAFRFGEFQHRASDAEAARGGIDIHPSQLHRVRCDAFQPEHADHAAVALRHPKAAVFFAVVFGDAIDLFRQRSRDIGFECLALVSRRELAVDHDEQFAHRGGVLQLKWPNDDVRVHRRLAHRRLAQPASGRARNWNASSAASDGAAQMAPGATGPISVPSINRANTTSSRRAAAIGCRRTQNPRNGNARPRLPQNRPPGTQGESQSRPSTALVSNSSVVRPMRGARLNPSIERPLPRMPTQSPSLPSTSPTPSMWATISAAGGGATGAGGPEPGCDAAPVSGCRRSSFKGGGWLPGCAEDQYWVTRISPPAGDTRSKVGSSPVLIQPSARIMLMLTVSRRPAEFGGRDTRTLGSPVPGSTCPGISERLNQPGSRRINLLATFIPVARAGGDASVIGGRVANCGVLMNGFPGRASPRGKHGRGHHTAIADTSPASIPVQRRYQFRVDA